MFDTVTSRHDMASGTPRMRAPFTQIHSSQPASPSTQVPRCDKDLHDCLKATNLLDIEERLARNGILTIKDASDKELKDLVHVEIPLKYADILYRELHKNRWVERQLYRAHQEKYIENIVRKHAYYTKQEAKTLESHHAELLGIHYEDVPKVLTALGGKLTYALMLSDQCSTRQNPKSREWLVNVLTNHYKYNLVCDITTLGSDCAKIEENVKNSQALYTILTPESVRCPQTNPCWLGVCLAYKLRIPQAPVLLHTEVNYQPVTLNSEEICRQLQCESGSYWNDIDSLPDVNATEAIRHFSQRQDPVRAFPADCDRLIDEIKEQVEDLHVEYAKSHPAPG